MQSIRKMPAGVTHEDLRQWAGRKIFNRGKDYVPCVSQLSRTEKDMLLAAAGELKKKKAIPLLDPNDDLYLEAFEENDHDWLDEEEEEEDQAPEDACVRLTKKTSSELEKLLSEKSRDELQTSLSELALDYPEVSRRLRDTARLETGQIDKLVRSLRKEIRNLSSQDAWFDPWKHEGNLPDYSHVGEQLQALGGGIDEQLAKAVAASHSDVALQIWQTIAERLIGQVKPKAYLEAAGYLRKMKKVFERTGRLAE